MDDSLKGKAEAYLHFLYKFSTEIAASKNVLAKRHILELTSRGFPKKDQAYIS